jgi:tRNA threonylcarbamoyladenosine biosynthesis protein TsaB
MPTLLALDTSTERMALSLCSAQGQWIYEGEGGAQASERLLPEALSLLVQAGLTLSQLDAIAFGQGPGAFTGLRTACAVTQGLALGAGLPVLAVDSLMLVAEDARVQALQAGSALQSELWVAMDARMGEIYAACYEYDGHRWQVLQAPALYKPEVLQQDWGEPAAVAGNALTVFASSLRVGAARCWPEMRSRAHALAALAAQAWEAGLQQDAALAMPVYVRDKVALTTQERLMARVTP